MQNPQGFLTADFADGADTMQGGEEWIHGVREDANFVETERGRWGAQRREGAVWK